MIISHDDTDDAIHAVSGEYETMPTDLDTEIIGCAGGGYNFYFAIAAENVPQAATDEIEPQLDEFDYETIKQALKETKRKDVKAYNKLTQKARRHETGEILKATIKQTRKTLSKIKTMTNELVRN